MAEILPIYPLNQAAIDKLNKHWAQLLSEFEENFGVNALVGWALAQQHTLDKQPLLGQGPTYKGIYADNNDLIALISDEFMAPFCISAFDQNTQDLTTLIEPIVTEWLASALLQTAITTKPLTKTPDWCYPFAPTIKLTISCLQKTAYCIIHPAITAKMLKSPIQTKGNLTKLNLATVDERITLNCQLAAFTLTFDALSTLTIGTVIKTDHPINQPLQAKLTSNANQLANPLIAAVGMRGFDAPYKTFEKQDVFLERAMDGESAFYRERQNPASQPLQLAPWFEAKIGANGRNKVIQLGAIHE